MYCNHCGAELPDGAMFCTLCGARVYSDGDRPKAEGEAKTFGWSDEGGKMAVHALDDETPVDEAAGEGRPGGRGAVIAGDAVGNGDESGAGVPGPTQVVDDAFPAGRETVEVTMAQPPVQTWRPGDAPVAVAQTDVVPPSAVPGTISQGVVPYQPLSPLAGNPRFNGGYQRQYQTASQQAGYRTPGQKTAQQPVAYEVSGQQGGYQVSGYQGGTQPRYKSVPQQPGYQAGHEAGIPAPAGHMKDYRTPAIVCACVAVIATCGVAVAMMLKPSRPVDGANAATAAAATTEAAATEAAATEASTMVPADTAAAATTVSTSAATTNSSGTTTTSAAPATSDFTYSNDRYGYSIEIPAGFAQTETAANGAGVVFTNPSTDMRITVAGNNNATGETVDSVHAANSAGHDTSYEAKGSTWSVVSYFDGDRDVYVKTYVGSGSTYTVTFSYPISQKDACDATLERVVTTAHPGDLSSSH